MSQKPALPDQNGILEDAWESVVGGMNWLSSVLLGEFADKRPLSAVVADMLVSFVPGVVIVTSARDAVAVIVRLACHPEKRDDLMEWVLLSACLIVIALPIAMAAAGAAALGAGAVVGGIAGSELGAVLRAVMLLLIKEASKLVELVRFLQQFIKGDVLKFLRAVKFAQYEKALLGAMKQIIGKLVEIVRALRTRLESLEYFETVKVTIGRLIDWEQRFYQVQQDAIKQMPRALAELDARLAKLLAQTAPKEAHTVVIGVKTDKAVGAQLLKQRVRDTPGKVLEKPEYKASKPKAITAAAPPDVKTRSKAASEISLKEKPEPIKSPHEGPNGKKQAVADAAAAADRERITQLAKEGKIGEAQRILQPYVDAAKDAKTSTEKQAAMDAIIARLDVTSDKEKMFWSGNKDLAAKIAKERGKTILEQTPGGSVIDGWGDLNKTFSWAGEGIEPHGPDFWGAVSSKYSSDATGKIDVIQDFEKRFPRGGNIWREDEWTTIVREGKVTSINVLGMSPDGRLVDSMEIEPNGAIAKKLFGEG
ncbi:hypothetical protein [Massilia agri]|uniref:Uncharacterized protein n=1 Tax=Massilia agri TaxID=1886785 RepID=A0ABT2AGV0_9BURK|nr:hypothetical protein [Massilia agri]MCS0595463.1 hypothetical protein [Massilia agri]